MPTRKYPHGTEKEHQIKRQNQYVANNYDRFTATFPKGKKEEYRKQAEKKGYSLNSYINMLIEKDRTGE